MSDAIQNNIRKAGLIGYPLQYSLSPKLHSYWLDQYAIQGEYKTHSIDPNNLRDDIFRLRDQGIVGLNVTLPHKESVIKLCDTITKEAEIIGAVNRLHFHQNGIIEGHNHDAYGFITHAFQTYSDLDLSKVLIIGAGGASRAIIYALKNAGAKHIWIVNRNVERAEILAEEFEINLLEWHEIETHLNDVSLLVNASAAGMKDKEPLGISIQNLPDHAVVYDIVYQPLMTELLLESRAKKLRIITGLGMLIYQAVPAFQAFFGVTPMVTPLVEDHLLS
jgi:shikimate dehydrogenase